MLAAVGEAPRKLPRTHVDHHGDRLACGELRQTLVGRQTHSVVPVALTGLLHLPTIRVVSPRDHLGITSRLDRVGIDHTNVIASGAWIVYMHLPRVHTALESRVAHDAALISTALRRAPIVADLGTATIARHKAKARRRRLRAREWSRLR